MFLLLNEDNSSHWLIKEVRDVGLKASVCFRVLYGSPNSVWILVPADHSDFAIEGGVCYCNFPRLTIQQGGEHHERVSRRNCPKVCSGISFSKIHHILPISTMVGFSSHPLVWAFGWYFELKRLFEAYWAVWGVRRRSCWDIGGLGKVSLGLLHIGQ